MAYQIISCLLLITIISGCHGYPAFAKVNLGAGVDANYKANGLFSYNSGKVGDQGINFDARSSADWFAAAGLDGEILAGDNGDGTSGLAVAAKAASKTAANIRGGVVGNIHDRKIKTGIDLGVGIAKTVGGSAGVFWANPEKSNDDWSFLDNGENTFLRQKA